MYNNLKINIIELDAQLASSEFDVVRAKTNFDLAKLALAQNLNCRENKPLEIATKEVKEPCELPTQEDLKQVKNRIFNAVINQRRAEFDLQRAKLQLHQEIEQAYSNLTACYEKYRNARRQDLLPKGTKNKKRGK